MTAPAPARAARPKSARTQARILEAALELFRERGFEATTMRAVAERAGVALGNAYYYFRSKEHLIQAFYGRTHREHLVICVPRLEGHTDLKERLLIALRTKFEVIEPYHRFAGVLFRSAADPGSPLNPFSPESQPVRREATALFGRVVDGSDARIPKDLKVELPELLWIYHMGLVLFWIHDRSPDRGRTHQLMARTVDLVVLLIRLASNPLLRPLRRSALRLVGELREWKQEAPGSAR